MPSEWFSPSPWWIVFAGVAFGIYYFAEWKGRTSQSVKALEDAVLEIKTSLDKVLDRLTRMGERLSNIEGRLSQKVDSSQSPVQLTDFGRKVSATAKAAEWAEEHAPKLVKDASGKEEFEVFKQCVEYVKKQYDARNGGLRSRIESSAYEHGTETDQGRRVFEIELRDKLLELIGSKTSSD